MDTENVPITGLGRARGHRGGAETRKDDRTFEAQAVVVAARLAVRATRGATVALIAATSLLAACEGNDRGEETTAPGTDSRVGPNTLVRIDAASGAVRQVIRVGPDPLELRLSGGQLWTQNFGDGSLTRIDPDSGRTVAVPGGAVAGIATDGDDLWLARDGNQLSRLDGATGVEEHKVAIGSAPIFAAGNAGFTAVGGGSVWLTVPQQGSPGGGQSLWRVEPETGRVLAKVAIGPDPVPPFVENGRLWLITGEGLAKVDMATNRISAIPVAKSPFGITAGAGAVWVGHQVSNGVWRIDPATGETSAKVDAGEAVRGLAFGGDRVWVATGTGLASIDPATNELEDKVTLSEPSADEGPIGVVYFEGSVWVSVE